MSIRTKTILIMIAFIIIPGMIFGVLVYTNARKALVDVRIAQLNNVALLKKERIETYFDGWKTDIRAFQHNPDVMRYLPVLIDRKGSQAIRYADALGEIREQMRALLADYGYLSVMLSDARGNVVYAAPEGRVAAGRKLSAGGELFREARRGVYFGDVYRRPSADGLFAMIAAAPLYDGQGTFIGEIVIEQDMGQIYRVVADSTGLGTTGEVVISRREAKSVLFLSPLKRDAAAALTRRVEFTEVTAQPSQKASLGETGSGFALDYSGTEVLAAWQYIPFLRWGLVTKIDAAEALAPVIRLRNLVILVTVIGLVLGIFVAVAAAKGVTGPVLDLQRGTAVIGSGNLDHKVGTGAQDEVGQLSRLIDAMTDSLKKVMASRDELNAEIEVRRRAERTISRLNRLYAVLGRVNETIVRVHEPRELYEQVCRIAVEDGGFKMAWIGLVEPATRRVLPAVTCGDDAGYLAGLQISAADVPEGRGPTGTAIRENRNVICSDIESGPLMAPWRERAQRHGFRSSAAFPLRSGTEAVGAITIYADTPRFFTYEEVRLLSALAEDVSFAMESIAKEDRRREEADRTALINALLKRFAQNVTRGEYLDGACELIREWSGFRHVGIRIAGLQGRIPFASCRGYDESFLETENDLSLVEDRCICTRVIEGKPEPGERGCMTASGSFYSGDALTFVDKLTAEERTKYRGVCMKKGYASLIVVPISYRDSVVGAIHLADERKGVIPPGRVEFIEQVAYIIGEAVYRFSIEDELRRNYEELRRSETRYRTLVEDVRDIIFTVSPEGTIVSINPAFGALTGLAPESWLGKHFAGLIHPDDLSLATETLGSVAAGQQVPLFELRMRTLAGEYRHFEFKIAANRTAEGMILGTARDVTERKKAEERLNLFVSLINQIVDAVYVVDTETSALVEFNDAACLSAGYSREELLSKKVTDLSRAQSDGERWNSHVAAVRKHGALVFDDVVYRKDGSSFPVEIAVKHIAHGQRSYLVAVLRDVTERKQAEEERARLVSAVESTAEAVVITDPHTGVIQYVNPAFEQLTGYSKEEALGRTRQFLESGNMDEKDSADLRESLARDGVWSGRLKSRKKDGSLYFEDVTVSPVRNRGGEIINYVYIKRDMTERLRLESAAESVSMMDNIGSVFSGVRHEIGNPINSMNMILGILRAKLDVLPTEDVRSYLDRMTDQVGRVEYILRSLKSFNLYETQQPQDLRIESFLESFLPLVNEDFELRGIAIDVSVAPGTEKLHADPRALQQVLLNILTNAADAVTGREDPRVAVAVLREGQKVLITVRDNGAGIPDDKLKDVFRPFFTTKPHGTGLGLVIVRKMLSQMNGSIDIRSRAGEGTTVTLVLPEGNA